MELTKNSKFKYGEISISLQRLAILNPILLKTYFIADNRFTLSEDALKCVNKIRNREAKSKILALDKYRKKMEKERKENALYNSSDNLKMGSCKVFVYGRVTRNILYGI